jgi:hypothetical protein
MTEQLFKIIKEVTELKAAPTKIQIGYTINNFTYHNGIVIQECCTAVMKLVMNIVSNSDSNLLSEMTKEGLRITIIGKK